MKIRGEGWTDKVEMTMMRTIDQDYFLNVRKDLGNSSDWPIIDCNEAVMHLNLKLATLDYIKTTMEKKCCV